MRSPSSSKFLWFVGAIVIICTGIRCASRQSRTSAVDARTARHRAEIQALFAGRVVARGRVLDGESGAPVPQAKVTATDDDGTSVEQMTDREGRFWIEFPPQRQPRRYRIAIAHERYPAQVPKSVLPDDSDERDYVLQKVVLEAPRRSDGVVEPVFLSGEDPTYTLEALKHGAQGTIVIDCLLTIEGMLRDCRIRESVEYLDQSVLRAVLTRRYRPAMKDGVPIPWDFTFRIKMRMPR